MKKTWITSFGFGLLAALFALPAAAQECPPAAPVAADAAGNPLPDIGPTNPVSTFSRAKKLARDTIYKEHRKTLYCGCDFVPNKKGTGGKIGTQAGIFNTDGCGYKVRKSELRGKRLEWEHIVPASLFGQPLSCWANGHAECVNSKGKAYKGRKCCAKVSEWFEHAEADLHNLAPAVGELNGDRSNHPYGMLVPFDEPAETATPDAILKHRRYGQCNFEVAAPEGGDGRLTEPMPDVRGDVARVWFYMSRAYDFPMSQSLFDMLLDWHVSDPVGAGGDTWEMTRDVSIEKIQGNRNPYVHGEEPVAAHFVRE